jgi:hypothetical protein
MVRIEELMEFTSRRKAEQIAEEMGYSRAEEYPEVVLQEVKRRSKKRSVSAKAQAEAEETGYGNSQQELDAVRSAAETRAAGLIVALDSLTMMHCATRKFSDPYLQQAVDESSDRFKDMLAGYASFYQPDVFLASTPLIAGGISGALGSRKLLNGNANLSNDNNANVIEIDS